MINYVMAPGMDRLKIHMVRFDEATAAKAGLKVLRDTYGTNSPYQELQKHYRELQEVDGAEARALMDTITFGYGSKSVEQFKNHYPRVCTIFGAAISQAIYSLLDHLSGGLDDEEREELLEFARLGAGSNYQSLVEQIESHGKVSVPLLLTSAY